MIRPLQSKLTINSELNIQEEMVEFLEALKRTQLKKTDQRLLVAETIFRTHHHFTAEQLTDFMKEYDQSVSKATIYRILGILVEAGLILEHDFGKGYKIYEHSIGHAHHDHLICQSCGLIYEFHSPEIEAIQQAIAAAQGFKIVSHALNLFGLCSDCALKSK